MFYYHLELSLGKKNCILGHILAVFLFAKWYIFHTHSNLGNVQGVQFLTNFLLLPVLKRFIQQQDPTTSHFLSCLHFFHSLFTFVIIFGLALWSIFPQVCFHWHKKEFFVCRPHYGLTCVTDTLCHRKHW
jgi:hypothetical protein